MKEKIRYLMDNCLWFTFLIMFGHGLSLMCEVEMYVHALQTLIIGMGIFSLSFTLSLRTPRSELSDKTKNFLWLISIVYAVILILVLFYGIPTKLNTELVSA